MGRFRDAADQVANAVRNRVTRESVRDTGCSLKIFRRTILDRIPMYDGLHRFLPTLVGIEGWRVVQVPVGHYPRLAGVSKYGIRNRLWRSLQDLMVVRWMQKRHLAYQVREDGAKRQ